LVLVQGYNWEGGLPPIDDATDQEVLWSVSQQVGPWHLHLSKRLGYIWHRRMWSHDFAVGVMCPPITVVLEYVYTSILHWCWSTDTSQLTSTAGSAGSAGPQSVDTVTPYPQKIRNKPQGKQHNNCGPLLLGRASSLCMSEPLLALPMMYSEHRAHATYFVVLWLSCSTQFFQLFTLKW
jgi:hypothetical protein